MQGSLLAECSLPVDVPGYTYHEVHWVKVWGPAGSRLRLVTEVGTVLYEGIEVPT